MKQAVLFCAVLILLSVCGTATAQEHPAGSSPAADSTVKPAARSDGVPIEQIIAAVSKKSGKKFIVDPRVSGNTQILGQDISAITYSDLLSILMMNGDTAVEGSNYISVIPINNVRAEPLPLATPKENFPEAQFVSMVIPVKNLSAPGLVPVIRPLLPTYGHLSAIPCANALVIVDNFANVKRLEKMIAALDAAAPYVAHPCEGEPAHPPGTVAHP